MNPPTVDPVMLAVMPSDLRKRGMPWTPVMLFVDQQAVMPSDLRKRDQPWTPVMLR